MIYRKTIKAPELSCQVLFHDILNGWSETGDYIPAG
jgi:hypothetical protein